MRHRLTLATEDWAALGHQDSELYRGARLAAVQEWIETANPQLTEDEQRFVDASVELAAEEERSAVELARARGRMVRRLRIALVGATVLLVIALVAGFVAEGQTRKADRAVVAAEAGRVGTQALTTTDITDSLLTAVAAARLDPSPMTERDLDAVVAQHPQLIGSVNVPAKGGSSSLAVSPDGRTLAVTDASHHIWTYDAHTLAHLAEAQIGSRTPASAGTLLDYSPTGQALAVGSPPSAHGPFVRLLDPRTLKPLPHQLHGWPRLPQRWGQLDGLGYSPNGKYLAASVLARGGFDGSPSDTSGTVLVWNMSKPALPPVYRMTRDYEITRVEPSSDGGTLYVATGVDNRLTAYSIKPGAARFQVSRGGDGALLELDPTGRFVAATDAGDNNVLLADARNGRKIQVLRGPTGPVDQIAFSHDGSELAATSSDGKITVWDDKSGSVLQDINDGAQSAGGVAFSPDGSTLFSTADNTDELHVWDLSGLRGSVSMVPIRHPMAVGDGMFEPSPRGDVVAYMGITTIDNLPVQGAWLVNLGTGTRLRLRPSDTENAAGGWSPDDQRFAMGTNDGWIRVFQRGGSRPMVQRHVGTNSINWASYSPDGRRLAYLDDTGNLAMLDATTLRPIGRSFRLPGTEGWFVSIGPDNRTAFVTGQAIRHHAGWQDPLNRWWLVDLVRGKVLEHGQLNVDARSTAFSPSGDRVAVGGVGGTVQLINVNTGQPMAPPVVANDGDVYWVTFNADGSRVASGANDVALLDGRTGELLSTAKVPGVVHAEFPAFRPDGTLSLASSSGRAYVWDPSLTHAISFACRAAGRDMTRAEWSQEIPGQPYRSVCPATG
jgi:WD40 repeat protein